MSVLTRPRTLHARTRARRRLSVEFLEVRLAPAGLLNGDFAISDPASPGYGWTTRGNASIANGMGVLDEGTTVQTEFSQTFTMPAGTKTLGFTIVAANLVSNGQNNPPDAFEAALLDSSTQKPLIGPPTGLSNTDAFLNIQQTGQVYYAPQVNVPGAGPSGSIANLNYPVNVTVNVSSIPAGTQATLYFDLIGFPPATSSVEIANVTPSTPTLPPTASAESVSTAENFATTVMLTGSDPNTPPLPLTYTITTDPTHGVLSGAAPNLTYLPTAGYFGPDSFQFEVNNGAYNSAPATVSVDVVGTPTATPQSLITSRDTALPITLTGSDPNTPPLPLTYQVGAGPAHGTLSGIAPNLVYHPDTGYSGPDSFTFRVSNGTAQSAEATIAMTVTSSVPPPPVAVDHSYTTQAATPLSVAAPGVLDGATGPPGVPLTALLVNGPAHGMLDLHSDGSFTYAPAVGFNGVDRFTYQASDDAVSNVATVTLTVTPVVPPPVQPPVAADHSYTAVENQPLNIAAPGVLDGVTSVIPGVAVTALLVTSTAHGTVQLNPDGSFTYSPNPGYTGPDRFRYSAVASVAGSVPGPVATASLTVRSGTTPILPDTPYYNYLRSRRNIDPARFDSYHPRIGAFLGLEKTGVPTTPTQLIPANHRFNAAQFRTQHAQNPTVFDSRHPILGFLYRLETPGKGPLLPTTPQIASLQAQYEQDPQRFEIRYPYYAAAFALEKTASDGPSATSVSVSGPTNINQSAASGGLTWTPGARIKST